MEGELVPIPINELVLTSGGSNGVAKEPWPLGTDGKAKPYKEASASSSFIQGNLIKHKAFTGAIGSDPQEINMLPEAAFSVFFNKHKLTLPIIDD